MTKTITSYGVTWPQCVNSSPPGQNGRHFADDVFGCIFVNGSFCILSKVLLKFVAKGPIDNNPILVQMLAWCRFGDKPLSEPMLIRYTDAYAELGVDELRQALVRNTIRRRFWVYSIIVWCSSSSLSQLSLYITGSISLKITSTSFTRTQGQNAGSIALAWRHVKMACCGMLRKTTITFLQWPTH